MTLIGSLVICLQYLTTQAIIQAAHQAVMYKPTILQQISPHLMETTHFHLQTQLANGNLSQPQQVCGVMVQLLVLSAWKLISH